MGFTTIWFIYALIGMLSFSGMALVLKKLTYMLPSSLILVYVFVFTAVMFVSFQLKTTGELKVGLIPLLWLLLAAALAYTRQSSASLRRVGSFSHTALG